MDKEVNQMKTRLLCFLLSLALVLSHLPAANASDQLGSAQNPYLIGTWDDFYQFLLQADRSQKTHYQLTNDIYAPADTKLTESATAANIVLEGDGFTIGGYTVENALFASIEGSAIRNVRFSQINVSGTGASQAVLASKIDDLTFVSGCTFDQCNVSSSQSSTSAAIAVAENYGSITNCVVNDTCTLSVTGSANDYFGGIAAVNNGEYGFIVNCISRVRFSAADGCIGTVGGVAAKNLSTIAYCYCDAPSPAETLVYDEIAPVNQGRYNKLIQCVYKETDGYRIAHAISEDRTISSVYELAAEMSESVMNNYNQSLNMSFFTADEYGCLWSVENGYLSLSLDGKTGQIFLYMDDSMENCTIKFTDPMAEEIPLSSNDSTMCKKFSLCVGSNTSDGYVRNTFTVGLYTQWDKMVNNFVLSPNADYVTKLPNSMDGVDSTYPHTMYLAPAREDFFDGGNNINYVSNSATQGLYPFAMTLSLKNEVVAYRFDGEGTAEIPYQIQNERELCILSDYVNNGVTYGDLPYSQAHYVLTADLNMKRSSHNDYFTPIGTMDRPFQGSFDGQGHWISKLRIETTQSYQGLFGCVEGIKKGDAYQNAVIKNVVIYDVTIFDGDDISHGSIRGGVVGQASHASIIGCVACGSVAGYTQIGGVVGYAYHCDIMSCGSVCAINTYSTYAWTGNIVGYADHTRIENCYGSNHYRFHNFIEAHNLQVGAIAGKIQDSDILDCYYIQNDDTQYPYHSGISQTDYETVTSEQFATKLSTNAEKLGLDVQWKSRANASEFPYPVPIPSRGVEHPIHCATTSHGAISASSSLAYMGAIVTITGKPITTLDFFGEPHDYQAPLTGIILKDVNGNILDITVLGNDDGSFEFVMPDQTVYVEPVYGVNSLVGAGTLENPYLLSTYQDLITLSDVYGQSASDYRYDLLIACYRMTNDIDCGGKEMYAIGNSFIPFEGRFDGGGYMISNLTLRNNLDSGLFGRICGGRYDVSVTNLTLKNISMPDAYGPFLAHVVDGEHPVTISNICIMDSQTTEEGCCLVSAVDTDVSFINCVFSNITFQDPNGSALLVCYAYGAHTITAKNILLENITGASKLIGAFITGISTTELDGLYYCGATVADLSHCQIKGEVLELSSTQLDDAFIANRSQTAYDRLVQYNAFPWGRDTDGRIRIAMDGSVPGIYHITYDDIFTSSGVKLLDLEQVPHNAAVGQLVELPYDAGVSLSNLKINDGAVRFATESREDTDVILFTMPNEPVHISNDNQAIVYIGLNGAGTESNPYLIQTPEELVLLSDVLNGSVPQDNIRHNQDYVSAIFQLTDNLDMTGINWEGIGATGTHFDGTFDGNGYAIQNLNVGSGRGDGSRNGLFMILGQNSIVQDLTILNADIFSENTPVAGAGAIAKANYGSIRRCVVENSKIQLGNWVHMGGISGINHTTGSIEYCAVINTVLQRRWGGSTSQTLGGITQVNNGRVAYCYSYNCTLSNGTAANGAIISSGNAPICCAYYTPSNTVALGGTYAKTQAEFASGAVTYLLNGNSSDNVQWYQNIMLEPEDPYPVLNKPLFVVYPLSDGTYSNVRIIESIPGTHDSAVTEVQFLQWTVIVLISLILLGKKKKLVS